MIDELANLAKEQVVDLLDNNASQITKELKDNPDGKIGVSIALNLRLVASRIYASGKLAYSRKFTDETEGFVEIDDPSQPKLSGMDSDTVTIQALGVEPVTVPMNKFKKAVE